MGVHLQKLRFKDLLEYRSQALSRYQTFSDRRLKLDLSRGKPCPDQLELSNDLLSLPGPGNYRSRDEADCRNYYGGVQGLQEARQLFAGVLGVSPDDIIVAGNSSLAHMHDALTWAMLRGVPGSSSSWNASTQGSPVFLCPVPGYDRHFAMTERLGIKMRPIRLTGQGPDMDEVECAVADPNVKGMWCVPQYSNPTGEIYSDNVIERLSRMRTASPDFRLFWDNAYAVHDLTDQPRRVRDILHACAVAGHPDRVFIFGSTSKMTFPSAGLALFASSAKNLQWYAENMSLRTIGPDKLNQLRHVRFLRDEAGVAAHMKSQRSILAPKFNRAIEVLQSFLGGGDIASWTVPQGGYFISIDVLDGTAKSVVQLAKAAGVSLVPAGATFPYGRDPNDRNIRLAPSFPSIEEVGLATEGVALSAILAAVDSLLIPQSEGVAAYDPE